MEFSDPVYARFCAASTFTKFIQISCPFAQDSTTGGKQGEGDGDREGFAGQSGDAGAQRSAGGGGGGGGSGDDGDDDKKPEDSDSEDDAKDEEEGEETPSTGASG